MLITTDGLVIKQRTMDTDDSLLTILTKDLGVVYAYAKGAKEDEKFSGFPLQSFFVILTLCYLKTGRGTVSTTLTSIRSFLASGRNITKLSLATYFAQLSGIVLPVEEPEEEAEAAPVFKLSAPS